MKYPLSRMSHMCEVCHEPFFLQQKAALASIILTSAVL